MRLGRCGEEPGGGQRERLEAWVGKKRRGPSRFRAAGGSPEQVRAAGGSEAGEPRGARGAAGSDKEAGARSRPHRPSTSPSPPLRKKEGNLRGKRDCPLLLLLRTAGREGLLSLCLSRSLSEAFKSLPADSRTSWPRAPSPNPTDSHPSSALQCANWAQAPGLAEACALRRARCGERARVGGGRAGARRAARRGGGAAGARVAAAGAIPRPGL